MNKLKIILIFVFIGTISVIGGAYFKMSSTTSHENFETKIFYNSITKNINNENVALSKFKGKWLLINFWATWCAPCREEIPDLNNLFNENKKINLSVISMMINMIIIFVIIRVLHWALPGLIGSRKAGGIDWSHN